jgi:hypothetical protein
MRPLLALVLALQLAGSALAGLTPELEKALREATFVYVQSGRPANGASPPRSGSTPRTARSTSARARRRGACAGSAGSAKARVAVGKPDRPAFEATAELVKDAALQSA